MLIRAIYNNFVLVVLDVHQVLLESFSDINEPYSLREFVRVILLILFALF